jgi:allantoate deiminase
MVSERAQSSMSRWLADLREVGAYDGGGLWRQPFTPADRAAKDMLRGWMEAIALTVHEDEVGNLFGRLEGREQVPPILSGSHIDSVKSGGHLDGALGLLAALVAVSELVREHGRPRIPIEVVALCGEELSRFRVPFIGSRGMFGKLTEKDLGVTDADGISLRNAMVSFGCEPDRNRARQKGDFGAFLELHIEQGPVLEQEGISVGVVTDIVGITQKRFFIRGEANHGGTTPMTMRRDALRTAIPVLARIPEICEQASRTAVATVGILEVKPGAVSNIPALVTFTLDVRDRSVEIRQRIVAAIDKLVAETCKRDGLEWSQETTLELNPTPMDSGLCNILLEEARRGNISCKSMVSGAGHDSMIFAPYVPTAMVFVPSKGGKSHTPEEDTDIHDIMQGVQLLYRALYRLGYGAP